MSDLAGLNPAFGTTRRFLSQISMEIGDMGEVEIGSAKGAMRVFRKQLLCGAKEIGESGCLGFFHFQISILSQACVWLGALLT
ncbi:MAG: hypothetical protein NDJ89_11440 [Oligoflexia bacterium]|nr:hypothetical protein [Oligoflexia bacterium]